MDNILDQYESDGESSRSSLNRSQDTRDDPNSSFHRQISGTSEDLDDDKDFEDVAAAIEDSLLRADADAEMEKEDDGGDDEAADGGTAGDSDAPNKIESSDENTSFDTSVAMDHDTKAIDIGESSTPKDDPADTLSFDEDIILPDPRCDMEKEQKERDRQKRKEIRSKKELEEEERERMQ